MMWKLMRDNFVAPMLRRLGTAGGVYLIGIGIDGDLTEQAMTGLVAIGLIAFDLSLSFYDRYKAAN